VEIPGTVLPCFFQILTEGLGEQTAVSIAFMWSL